jgi:hypothetical protein
MPRRFAEDCTLVTTALIRDWISARRGRKQHTVAWVSGFQKQIKKVIAVSVHSTLPGTSSAWPPLALSSCSGAVARVGSGLAESTVPLVLRGGGRPLALVLGDEELYIQGRCGWQSWAVESRMGPPQCTPCPCTKRLNPFVPPCLLRARGHWLRRRIGAPPWGKPRRFLQERGGMLVSISPVSCSARRRPMLFCSTGTDQL